MTYFDFWWGQHHHTEGGTHTETSIYHFVFDVEAMIFVISTFGLRFWRMVSGFLSLIGSGPGFWDLDPEFDRLWFWFSSLTFDIRLKFEMWDSGISSTCIDPISFTIWTFGREGCVIAGKMLSIILNLKILGMALTQNWIWGSVFFVNSGTTKLQ